MKKEGTIQELFEELIEDKTERQVLNLIIQNKDSEEIVDALLKSKK